MTPASIPACLIQPAIVAAHGSNSRAKLSTLRPDLANAMIWSLKSAGYGVLVLGMWTPSYESRFVSTEPGELHWSYDFVESRTHDGRKFRMLNVIDEFTRECLAIRVDRKLNSTAVIDVLTDLFILRGVPGHVRSDNGPEFIAKAVRDWIDAVGAKTAFIEPGSPWENGYCESFNSKLRDELLNGEIFYSLAEARVVIEAWRVHYNTARPHSSRGYRPPAPQVVQWPSCSGGSQPPQATTLPPRPVMH